MRECGLAARLGETSLKVARLEDDAGTALITCSARATCERLAAPKQWWWYACPEVPGRR